MGVIAQELELISPGLVKTSTEDEMGIKSVKTSIMYMKGMKALQEAMERIEELERSKEVLVTKNLTLEVKYENLLERIISLENN
jgi:predicted nuclease with TOPRIM domain